MSPAAYDELIHAISELESDEFLEDLAEQLGHKVEELIERTFQTATAPDGKPWAPRKLAAGRKTPPHFPLRKSYEMHDSFHVETNRAGVRVTNPVPYTGFQNDGTRYITARPMVPDNGDLGTWEEPLRDVAQAFFNSKINEGT